MGAGPRPISPSADAVERMRLLIDADTTNEVDHPYAIVLASIAPEALRGGAGGVVGLETRVDSGKRSASKRMRASASAARGERGL